MSKRNKNRVYKNNYITQLDIADYNVSKLTIDNPDGVKELVSLDKDMYETILKKAAKYLKDVKFIGTKS